MISNGDGENAVRSLLRLNAVRHPDWYLLGWAAREGDAELAARLLSEGAEADTPAPVNDPQTWELQAPLYQAAWTGHADLVEMLLANGAEVNAKDMSGRTLLRLVRHWGHAADELVQLIEVHGGVE
jgi:ankyrin repeat protein